MSQQVLREMSSLAEHATLLAGIFQIPSQEVRAVQLRKAEKYLTLLESFFTSNLTEKCLSWKRGYSADKLLSERLAVIEVLEEKMATVRQQIMEMDARLANWMSCSEKERQKFLLHALKVQSYFDNRTYFAESHILHRYERFQTLKNLAPYADSAGMLCEAIHHYENREKYEGNRDRLVEKKEAAAERLLSVRRGYYLAIIFCFLLVTIPLCAPFAFSLFQRKREIESQIASLDEIIRREERRIAAADEGVVAAHEIREALGDIPLNEIRQVLGEVAELRREFNTPSGAASATAQILIFLETEEDRLTHVFGAMPVQNIERFRWYLDRLEAIQKLEKQKVNKQHELAGFKEKLAKYLKGHTAQIVRQSLANIRKSLAENVPLPCEDWIKEDFAGLAIRFPEILQKVRGLLWSLSRGQSIDEEVWKRLGTNVRSESNILEALSLEIVMNEQAGLELSTNTMSGEKKIATI
jgi:hypothetical protein